MTTHPATDARGVLYRGGPIVTADPRRPRAEAVATRQGRIIAAGSERDCRRALGLPADTPTGDDTGTAAGEPPDPAPGVEIVDLDGRALLPGFIDAHLHPMAMCFFAQHLDLTGTSRMDDLLDALADHGRARAPGEWVVGVRLDPERLAERRLPTMDELDRVGAGRAVVCLARDGHTSVGNSVALAAAGIRPERLDPIGGAFERDREMRLTGVCRATATRLLIGAVPIPDLDQVRTTIRQVFDGLLAHGITSVGFVLQTDEEGPGGHAGALEARGMMYFADEVPVGAHTILCGQPQRAMDARRSSDLHAPARNRVVGGVKLFFDGTLSGRGACLHDGYADDPSHRGWLTIDPRVAAARMEAIHLAGLQICIHAIGDAANSLALDLFADLLARHPTGGDRPRHRIEHASVLDEAMVERFAELGVVAVVQPPFLRHAAPWLHDRLGPERVRHTYAFRRLLDAGVVLAGSSDAPATDTDVLAGIAAAVTRHGLEPHQAVTAEEAVAMYTRQAAIAQERDHLTGRIAEGLRADLVVLSDDPTRVPPDRIAGIGVCQTVVGGRRVYEGPSGSPAPAAPAGSPGSSGTAGAAGAAGGAGTAPDGITSPRWAACPG